MRTTVLVLSVALAAGLATAASSATGMTDGRMPTGGQKLGFSLVDVDTGYCKLTMTYFGAIGYDAPPADAGNGFRYPKSAGSSALFYSSLLIGNDTTYIADRHFSRPANGGVNTDFLPVDSLQAVVPPDYGDEQYEGSFDDRGHPSAKQINVYQYGYMSANPAYDDFVVLDFWIVNEGTAPINGLYAGVWSDFDIGTDPTTNTATSDTVRRLSFMRMQSSANPTVGTMILEPSSFRNLTAVDHARWVYPTDSCVRDAQKFRLLNGTIMQRNSNRPYDWSVLISIGPFDLDTAQGQRFSVAFVGGTDENACRANADSAQAWYDREVAVREGPRTTPTERRISVQPNPFRSTTSVSYAAAAAGRLELVARDAAGRVVEELAAEVGAGAGTYVWRPRRLARGVYFLDVITPESRTTTKILKLQ